jgi:exodeoxyribonuclease-3
MKIASFNVNSLRARLPIVIDWLKNSSPDVVCFQETKVQDPDFPKEAFEGLGYNFVFKGQPKYNGVAIFSKEKIENVKFGLLDEPKDEARVISAKIGGISIVNTYVPQGYMPESEKFTYKLDWFKRLRKYFEKNFKASDFVVWLGDLNVAPEAKDVYDPEGLMGHVCFCPEITQALEHVKDWGLVDVFRMLCDEPCQYTFWDYRNRGGISRNHGWRLDHIMATKPLAKKCTSCSIDKQPRTQDRPSDHTPIIADFDIK